ncbi:MAG: DinB family protein [Chloroflexi bacterium]|nr:DinB family protein [Chloroflexota bacterium]MDA1146880.1 DinB family protein [Chloroflexota bacterium]
MSEDREALLQYYGASRARLVAAIDGLDDTVLAEPSLDGWSVKDHLAHIASWDELRATEVDRISAGYDSTWRTTEDQSVAFGAMSYELRRGLSLAQVRWELTTSRARLLEAIAAATPRGLNPALYGEAGLRSGHEDEHSTWIERRRGEQHA